MQLLCVPHFRALLKRGIAVSLKCISLLSWIRSRMNKWFESPQNFGRLVLACIETDFCKWILNTRAKALDDICKIDRLLHHSDLKISAKISSDFSKWIFIFQNDSFSKTFVVMFTCNVDEILMQFWWNLSEFRDTCTLLRKWKNISKVIAHLPNLAHNFQKFPKFPKLFDFKNEYWYWCNSFASLVSDVVACGYPLVAREVASYLSARPLAGNRGERPFTAERSC